MKVLLVSEGGSELAGALRNLVNRLAPVVPFEFDVDRVSRRDIHAHHGKGQGYFKRAVRWMIEAHKREYDALILVIDEDGQAERRHEITKAQQYDGTPIRRALGVAIRTFDAWMLADEKALTTVLEYDVARQPNPEINVDPKTTCAELLKTSATLLEFHEMYAAIANEVDLHILESRCKKGFAPFAQRVKALDDEAESD